MLKIVERLIVEMLACSQNDLSVNELKSRLKLQNQFVSFSAKKLLNIKIIQQKNGLYSLDKDSQKDWSKTINQDRNRLKELTELMSTWVKACLSKQEKTSFRLQKLWMTKDEELVLQTLFSKIEDFTKRLIKEQPKRDLINTDITKKRLLVWGTTNHEDLLKSYFDNH